MKVRSVMEEKQQTLNDTNALSTEEMKSLVVVGRALADPTRIRILGLLAERSMYGQELAKVLDVTPPTVSHHMEPLVNAGLVHVRKENNYHYYELDRSGLEQLDESIQHLARMFLTSEPLPPKSDEKARVVASFIKDGRLVSIPAQYKKRRYVMGELARSFEWGRLYDEKEVNAILKTFHDDVASLRREFIDQRIMMRESGRYWLVRPNE
jgi:DNA-binding MarR family transcriptional regulator